MATNASEPPLRRAGAVSAQPARVAAPVALSIVAPMHNEAEAVAEFVRRCTAAGAATRMTWELIVCDDASTDDTAARLETAAAAVTGEVRVLRQARNLGQIGATLAGLAAARGSWVVVLDGDLQDPPEVIVALWRTTTRAATPSAVFAVKQARDDPPWFLAGRGAFSVLQAALGGSVPPRGAGAFCLLPGALARRLAHAQVDQANLATLVMAVLERDGEAGAVATVSYTKAARHDGKSRVGVGGLAREAVGSLELSGAAGRGLRIAATLAAIGAVGVLPTIVVPPVGVPLVAGAGWLAREAWRAGRAADERAATALAATER